eukprot:5134381-Pyramimonas_sp.AAC.1
MGIDGLGIVGASEWPPRGVLGCLGGFLGRPGPISCVLERSFGDSVLSWIVLGVSRGPRQGRLGADSGRFGPSEPFWA